jgi:hypothetical protein
MPCLGGSYTRTHVIDRVVRRVESLPGTGVAWVLGLAVVLGVLVHLPSWIAGDLPLGTFVPDALTPSAFLAYFLGLIVVLDAIARAAFAEYRTSLDLAGEEQDRLLAALTSIPDRQAVAAMVVLALVIGAGYALDPAATAGDSPMPQTLWATSGAAWLIVEIAIALVVVHTLQQLRLVNRLHALAARVDLLEPGPDVAFSRLTAATAIGILVMAAIFAAPDPDAPTISVFGLLMGVAFMILAAVSFALPLLGMHGRLVAEKARLLGNVHVRLRSVLATIHGNIDSGDLSRADELQKMQAALLAERDLYARLSTWPWSPGTIRALASAVLLPIILGIALRLVARIV